MYSLFYKYVDVFSNMGYFDKGNSGCYNIRIITNEACHFNNLYSRWLYVVNEI